MEDSLFFVTILSALCTLLLSTEWSTAVDSRLVSLRELNVVGSSAVPIDSPALPLNSLPVRFSLTFDILPGNQNWALVLCSSRSSTTSMNLTNCSPNTSRVSMKTKAINNDLASWHQQI